MNNSITPLTGKKIMIDPGHGGKFPGAIGPTGVKEKDVVLGICTELFNDLVELGADVRMTRMGDTEVLPGGSLKEDLNARVEMANSWPAELFISVHANANEKSSPNGTETYHARQASDRSKALAKLVQQSCIETVHFANRGVKSADFVVIKNTKMPAILLETGFLSNPDEEKKLADPAIQSLFADAITKGVRDYFNIESHLLPDGPSQVPGEPTPDDEYYLAPGDPAEPLFANR